MRNDYKNHSPLIQLCTLRCQQRVVWIDGGVVGGAPMQGVPLVAPLGSPTSPLLLMCNRRRCRCLLRLRLLLLLVQLLDRLNLLLQLHSPILEPDLDLPFRQAERVCHLDPPPPGQIVVRVEFLFELQSLVARVGLSAAPAHSIRPCKQRHKNCGGLSLCSFL